VAEHPGPLRVFFRRIEKRKNYNVAVVATARKLVTIAFLMLKNNEPYRYSLPGPTQRKLSAFRVEATGSRRPKSKLRLPMQRREPGTRVQSIPSLDEVYLSENLPPITQADALAAAETRMLQRMAIADLPQRLQVSRHAPINPVKQHPRTKQSNYNSESLRLCQRWIKGLIAGPCISWLGGNS
jgi:transposase